MAASSLASQYCSFASTLLKSVQEGTDGNPPLPIHPPGPLLSLAEGRISHFVCPVEAKKKVKPRGWRKLVLTKHTHTRAHTNTFSSTQTHRCVHSLPHSHVHTLTHRYTRIHKYKRGLGQAPAPLCLAGASGRVGGRKQVLG